MKADAWSEWAGRAPEAPPGRSSVPADPPELDDLHEFLVSWAARLLGAEDALLWMVEGDRRGLVVRAGIGRFSASVGRRLGKGEGLAGQAWRTGTPQTLTGLPSLPQPPVDGGWRAGVGAALCVPLAAGRSVVAVLGVAWSDPGRVVDRAETELLGRCAELAGVAIDRAGRLAGDPRPGGRARAGGGCPGTWSATGRCPSRSPLCSIPRCIGPTAR
jgi:GAF domain